MKTSKEYICRFYYNFQTLRHLLDQNGFQSVKIIAADQQKLGSNEYHDLASTNSLYGMG